MERNGLHVQAWRLSRHESVETLAGKANLSPVLVDHIEAGHDDVRLADLESIAQALGIPVPWLYADPQQLDLLFNDGDGDDRHQSYPSGLDPVLERIIKASTVDRTLYVLVTALLESGDAKLLRAAEVSLKSLIKQSRQAALPWQSRTPGNFEPPSD